MNEKNKCKQCGACCANVLLLTPEEILQIKEYIVTNNIKPINRNSVLSLNESVYVNACPFLTKDNLCSIYKVRPKFCQEFECSSFCDISYSNETNFKDTQAINMIKTFYPDEFCPNIDKEIDDINRHMNNLKKKIYNK